MAKIDENFISMCTDIIENGTTTEGQKVRPHWPDGTPAYTIKKFGVVTRYDLSKEFPVLTLRKTPIKSALDELLWIWQQKSNNIHDLHSGVWDEWADTEGSIGRAYGYQMSVKNKYYDVTKENLLTAFGEFKIPSTSYDGDTLIPSDPGNGGSLDLNAQTAIRRAHAIRGIGGAFYMDQVDRVLYDLKVNPFSRRILASIYTFQDLHAMHLYPCAYSMTFNVTQKKGSDKLTLNGILNQRSQDILAAFAWNEWQYACLLALIAQSVGMEAGEFVHVVADAHIYDRHVDAVKELMSRTPQPAPKVWINPDIHDFYQFTRDDVRLVDYKVAGDQIRNIPIAI